MSLLAALAGIDDKAFRASKAIYPMSEKKKFSGKDCMKPAIPLGMR